MVEPKALRNKKELGSRGYLDNFAQLSFDYTQPYSQRFSTVYPYVVQKALQNKP